MKTKLLFLALLCASLLRPQAPVISGDTMLCPNSSGTALITSSQTYDTYQWYWRYWFGSNDFAPAPGQDGPTFTYDWQTYDQAQIKLVVTLGGNTYESNVIQIDSYAWVGLTTGFENAPNVSVNPDNGDVMLCEGTGFTLQVYQPYTIVQWFCNGVAIEDANTMELHVTEPGSYYAVASPAFCPDSTSSTEGLPTVVVIDTTCGLAAQQFEKQAFSISPNPVTNVLHVKSISTIDRIFVYSLTGQNLMALNPGANEASLDLSGVAGGVYVLRVESPAGPKSFRILKQ